MFGDCHAQMPCFMYASITGQRRLFSCTDAFLLQALLLERIKWGAVSPVCRDGFILSSLKQAAKFLLDLD